MYGVMAHLICWSLFLERLVLEFSRFSLVSYFFMYVCLRYVVTWLCISALLPRVRSSFISAFRSL